MREIVKEGLPQKVFDGRQRVDNVVFSFKGIFQSISQSINLFSKIKSIVR